MHQFIPSHHHGHRIPSLPFKVPEQQQHHNTTSSNPPAALQISSGKTKARAQAQAQHYRGPARASEVHNILSPSKKEKIAGDVVAIRIYEPE
jgi:hypothetical protein